MYRRIMVPLDGSELAECVLPHVKAIIKCDTGSEVFLVRVYEPPYMPAYLETYIRQEDLKRSKEVQISEAEDYLNRIAERLKADGTEIKSKVISGKPAESLEEFATRNNVDLTIIATHGRSGVSRWVWGSVTDRLLRALSSPVLVVRAPGCGL